MRQSFECKRNNNDSAKYSGKDGKGIATLLHGVLIIAESFFFTGEILSFLKKCITSLHFIFSVTTILDAIVSELGERLVIFDLSVFVALTYLFEYCVHIMTSLDRRLLCTKSNKSRQGKPENREIQ
jgi:hypothetical protein